MRNIRRTFNASKNFSSAWKFSGIGIKYKRNLLDRSDEIKMIDEMINHILANSSF